MGVLPAAVVLAPAVGVDLVAVRVVALVAGAPAVAQADDPVETTPSEAGGATGNADLMANDLSVQEDQQGMANAHQGRLETATEGRKETATESAALMATDRAGRRAMANANADLMANDLSAQADHRVTATVAHRATATVLVEHPLDPNAPNGSVGLSGETNVSEARKSPIR